MLPSVTNFSIIQEWDFNKNILNPHEISAGSDKKVWWLCSKCKHSWRAQINSRRRGAACPICSNRSLVKQVENSFAFLHPELSKEWSPKNKLKSTEVYAGSTKRVLWVCSLQHEYVAEVGRRVYRNIGCPYCSDRKVLTGFNDLKTKYPDIAKEFTSNNHLKSEEIIYKNSQVKFEWSCSEGHIWNSIVRNRTILSSKCPECSKRNSNIEKEFRETIRKTTEHLIIGNERKALYPYEIDVFVPELNIGIEFNGDYWHSDKAIMKSHGMKAKEYHERKVSLAKANNILLFFVWQYDWLNNKQEIMNSVDILFESKGSKVSNLLTKLSLEIR